MALLMEADAAQFLLEGPAQLELGPLEDHAQLADLEQLDGQFQLELARLDGQSQQPGSLLFRVALASLHWVRQVVVTQLPRFSWSVVEDRRQRRQCPDIRDSQRLLAAH